MGSLNRYPAQYPDPEPPRSTQAPAQARKTRTRWYVVGAIILVLLVLFGLAIFIARLGGRGPARQGTPPAPAPGMWIASP